MTTLQELSIDDIFDPTVPLERKRRAEASSTGFVVREKYRNKAKILFNDKCHWFQKKGQRIPECRRRPTWKSRSKIEQSVSRAIGLSAKMTKEGTVRDFVVIEKIYDHKDKESWIIDSDASHHFSRNDEDLRKWKMENGTILTAGSENLVIKQSGTHKKYESGKVVPDIEKKLLSVGQMTQDPKVSVKFQGSKCTAMKGDHVVTRRVRGKHNLYRTTDTKNMVQV